jgi:hypothetical protein
MYRVCNNIAGRLPVPATPRAHQTRRRSHPISAEIALPRLQSEIVVALFPFASRSFLANNLRFKVKVIDKAIVINVKIHKNERKRSLFKQ